MKPPAHLVDDVALHAAYEFLRRAAFFDFVLPQRVTLRVRRKKGCEGFHYPYRDVIDVCPDTKPYRMLRTLAHEMCHLVLEKHGDIEKRAHDSTFRTTAAIICRRMGWPLKGF